ncbi:MAG: hypothetical protein ACLTG4_03650 [Oscillospiraceae bacterium]
MLVARSGYVHDRLRRVLHTGGFRRTYLAPPAAPACR